MLKKINSIEFAHYVLSKTGPIDALKLQKIIFYVNSFHLAVFNDDLFDEDFEAWTHGPVLGSVYHEFKHQSRFSLLINSKVDRTYSLDFLENQDQAFLINNIIDLVSQYDGLTLRNQTHNEEPWEIARKGYSHNEKSNVKMDRLLIKKFYRKKLSTSTNPKLREINRRLIDSIEKKLMEKHNDVWVELAK